MSIDSKHMEVLRSLTPQLSKFPPAVIERAGFKEFKVLSGKCFVFNLFRKEEVAVAKAYLSSGALFQKHTHEEKEFLIIYEGKITIYFADDCVTLGVGDYIVLEPGTQHAVQADEESCMIAITIPANKDFPNDGEKL